MAINSTRNLSFLLMILSVILFAFFADYLGFCEGIDTYIYDISFRMRGSRPVSDRIVIAAIDEKALGRLGRWPISRSYYARMLEFLGQSKTVAFDLIMTEPSADDTLFAHAIKQHGSIILPVYIDSRKLTSYPLANLKPLHTGHIHVEHGVNNVARGVFHTLFTRENLIPSLASVTFETVSGTYLPRHQKELPSASALPTSGTVFQQDFHKLNFYGPPGTFPQISLVDIIDGKYPPAFFKEKIIFVGLTAPGIVDEISTPFSQDRNRMAGVEVHATALNNLLDNSSVKDLSDWRRTIIVLLSTLLLGFVFLRLNEKHATLTWVFSLFMITAIGFYLFVTFNLWLPPAFFYLSFTTAYIITYLYRLDGAARELDREYDVISALVSGEPEESSSSSLAEGMVGYLSKGGIDGKIQKLLRVEQRYGKHLEDTVQRRTHDLSEALNLVGLMSDELILRLTKATESKDEETGEHIIRIGIYAHRLAEELGLPNEFINNVRFASAMHDIGKIGIPDKILLKPTELDHAEMKVMKTHTVIGESILANSPYPKIQMSASIALNHHENWDGSGYPQGLKGEEIPLEARIVHICDCYDALRSKRHYKPALDHRHAYTIITQGDTRTMPGHFDPRVLRAFVDVESFFEDTYNSYSS